MRCTRTRLVVVASACTIGSIGSTVLAANVLTDPSYETSTLTSLLNVITNYPGFAGQWGDELASIVTSQNSVTPLAGNRMLRLDNTGGGYSQVAQVVDLTSLASQIDAGQVAWVASAMFNANLPAAQGSVVTVFVDASANHSNITGPVQSSGNVIINANPGDWESISINGSVPFGTRWAYFQVAYWDASLIAIPGTDAAGYVDAANFDIRVIPEPTTLAALMLPTAMLLRRR